MPPDIADALGSKPIAVRTFEVQAAFAMTFNKLQGATMESLVVVMTELKGLMMGSHTAAKAGVAFTRVKHSRTLGIFPCEDGELDHLLKLQHPGWLRAWARNYDDDGYWLRDRLPIDPVALTTYRDWKHANPNNPTSGVGVTDLKRVTTAAGLSTRLKAPCGSKTKTGFESRPMRRAELVAQLARLYPQFEEELLRALPAQTTTPPARQPPRNQRPLSKNKNKRAATTAQLPPPNGTKTKRRAAPVTSTVPPAAAVGVAASAPQQTPCPLCSNCGSSISICKGKCEMQT